MRVFTIGCFLLFAAASAIAQSGAKSGEWHSYGGDLGHTRYSHSANGSWRSLYDGGIAKSRCGPRRGDRRDAVDAQ